MTSDPMEIRSSTGFQMWQNYIQLQICSEKTSTLALVTTFVIII